MESLTLKAFEALYDTLSTEEQETFIRKRPLKTDILLVYKDCNESTKHFSSIEVFRAFIIEYLQPSVLKDVKTAHADYLKMLDNAIESCPASYYSDFYQHYIKDRELKDYPLETLLTIINICYDNDGKKNKQDWQRYLAALKHLPRYDREDVIKASCPAQSLLQQKMLQDLDDPLVKRHYKNRRTSGIWVIRQVCINGELLFSEHCTGHYLCNVREFN